MRYKSYKMRVERNEIQRERRLSKDLNEQKKKNGKNDPGSKKTYKKKQKTKTQKGWQLASSDCMYEETEEGRHKRRVSSRAKWEKQARHQHQKPATTQRMGRRCRCCCFLWPQAERTAQARKGIELNFQSDVQILLCGLLPFSRCEEKIKKQQQQQQRHSTKFWK